MCRVVYFFFFFKQKTAYEMRISDWSSDVVLFRSDPGTDGGHRGAKGRSRRRDLTARAGHFEGMRNMSEPIIICGDGRISRTGLEDRSRRAAGLFAAAGIGAGRSVAVLLPNRIAFIEAMLGAQHIGPFAVPINWHFAYRKSGV